MKKWFNQKSISGIAALLVFGVFAIGILSVLLSGASAYSRLTHRDRLSYDARTCAQYLAAKVRQAPCPQALEISSFGSGDAMVISQNVNGEEYLTRIYCHDGWIMELFTSADGDFAPEDGEKIVKGDDLDIQVDGALMTVSFTDGNGKHIVRKIYIRGGEEALS